MLQNNVELGLARERARELEREKQRSEQQRREELLRRDRQFQEKFAKESARSAELQAELTDCRERMSRLLTRSKELLRTQKALKNECLESSKQLQSELDRVSQEAEQLRRELEANSNRIVAPKSGCALL